MTATVIKLVRKKGMNTQGGRENTRQRLGNARKKTNNACLQNMEMKIMT